MVDGFAGVTGSLRNWTLTLHGEAPRRDDLYVLTDEYSAFLAREPHRGRLRDADGGVDTLNTGAVSSSMVSCRAAPPPSPARRSSSPPTPCRERGRRRRRHRGVPLGCLGLSVPARRRVGGGVLPGPAAGGLHDGTDRLVGIEWLEFNGHAFAFDALSGLIA